MESIGVKLKLEDYRRMFESLDYNNEGEIDFTKFCFLNTDKKVDLKELVIIFINNHFCVETKGNVTEK